MWEFIKQYWVYVVLALILAIALVIMIFALSSGKKSEKKDEAKETIIKEEKPLAENKKAQDSNEGQGKEEVEKTSDEPVEEVKVQSAEKKTNEKTEKKDESKMKNTQVKAQEDQTDAVVTGADTYRVVYDKEAKNWIVKIDGGKRASRR